MHFVRYALFGVGMALSAAAASTPIFVLNSLDANVSIVDPSSYKEVRRVPTGKEPHHLYLTPDQKSLMVANATSDSITLMDPKTGEVQRTLTGIVDPYQLQFSPDMKWFVTAANRLDHIDIYSWHPLEKGFDLKLVKRIPAGKTPADVFLTPDQKTLLVALTGDSYVEAYDVSNGPAKLVTRIKTAAGAHAFRAQGDQRHLFVSNRTANSISRIDLQTLAVTDTFPVPGGPDCMDVLADGKTLLVTSRWARKLTVVDLEQKKVVNQVPVGKSPHGVWTLNHAPTR